MKSNFQVLIKLNICKTSQVRDPDPAIYNQSKFFKYKSSLDEIWFSKKLEIYYLFFLYCFFLFIFQTRNERKIERPKLILVFLLCCNYFLLPFLESLLCITVMYYNIKTVITISILYVKYKYMYQDLCIYISIG